VSVTHLKVPCGLEHRVFNQGLCIGVFVNKKRLAGYLSGGVLLVGLLIGGYLFWYYETGQDAVYRNPPTTLIDRPTCADTVEARCVAGSESFNLSEIECRQGSNRPDSLRSLPSVEDVNESSGVVTCDTSAANTSN
jgi:hypothetical protein